MTSANHEDIHDTSSVLGTNTYLHQSPVLEYPEPTFCARHCTVLSLLVWAEPQPV